MEVPSFGFRSPYLGARAAPSTHATARRLSEAYEPVLRRLGVTRPQYLLLAMLWERDGSTPRRLAARLRISEATVNAWLVSMEAARLVERDLKADPADVWLSPRGRALQAYAPQVPSALLCHVLAWLDARESAPAPESLGSITHRPANRENPDGTVRGAALG